MTTSLKIRVFGPMPPQQGVRFFSASVCHVRSPIGPYTTIASARLSDQPKCDDDTKNLLCDVLHGVFTRPISANRMATRMYAHFSLSITGLSPIPNTVRGASVHAVGPAQRRRVVCP